MRPWLFLMGGMGVWFVHLMGVYGVASLADLFGRADAWPARAAVGGLTVACAAGDAALIWLAATGSTGGLGPAAPELGRFWRSVAGGGAALSLIAVLWQGLPALVGH